MPLAVFFHTSTPATIVSSNEISAAKSEVPPTDQAFETGAYEISNAVRPPIAVEAITPALNKPAKPHCMLRPIDITAEIRHRLTMASATFHDCPKPTIAIIRAIMEKLITARLLLLTAPSRVIFQSVVPEAQAPE